LNLLPINPPLQTGDSNLVADKTINSSHKEKVPQQKTRRHVLASPPLVAPHEMTNVETADPACSARFGTPSFVCFDCSKLSVFESALHQPTLAKRRSEFS